MLFIALDWQLSLPVDHSGQPVALKWDGESTVAWYRCTMPNLFCGYRRTPFLVWEENNRGHVE